MLNIYSFYHLNTSYSSIETENIPSLVDKCYWPLLKLIEKSSNFKIAVEASGKTLNDINSIDSSWTRKLAELIKAKKCEFIGSGYSQIISPSVPNRLTEKNLEFGFEIYLKLLKYKPKLGLINEQAFSKSMVKIYNKYFDAIVLDWIEIKKNIKNIIKKDQCPSFIKDDYGNKIQVIWSNSLSFQKFQRFIFGEINLSEYLNYVKTQKFSKFLCIYSNDCEIFNFRPKRFSTELPLLEDEWKKIFLLYKKLEQEKKIKFCFPSHSLKLNDKKCLIVNNDFSPIVVKKQPKYNISRWLVCGKNNFDLNKFCWQLYSQLIKKKDSSKFKWIRLCEYWSSDFRTHCTEKKYKKVIKNIKKDLNNSIKNNKSNLRLFTRKIDVSNRKNFQENKNLIIFENKKTKIILNKKKGLAIDKFIVKKISNKSLFGTIYAGSLKDLINQSDFFSGHFNLFDKDLNKITDLSVSKKNYNIYKNNYKNFCIEFLHKFHNSLKIKKKLEIDLNKSILYLKLDFENISPKILRVFNTTINPEAFEKKSLMFSCKNGGDKIEKFLIKNNFNYGAYIQDVTKLTSSNNCLPMTDGRLTIGDKKKELIFSFKNSENPFVGLLEYQNLNNKFFLRNSFSAREIDDTFSMTKYLNLSLQIKIEAKNK